MAADRALEVLAANGVEGVVRSVVLEAIDTKDQDSYKSLADEEMERRRSLMITKEM